jgi:hypothetical protein
MKTLGEIARLIRSKNAGPFVLTFDVMFGSDEDYERVRRARVLTKETFAALYDVDPASVLYFECPNARAIKISIPRPRFQGDLGDADMHGGQQYAPLIGLQVP